MTRFRKVSALFASLVLSTAVLAAFFGLLGSPHIAYAASHQPASCSTIFATLEDAGVSPDGQSYINVYLGQGDSTLTGSGDWSISSGDRGTFTLHPGNGFGVNGDFAVNGHGTVSIAAYVTWNSGQSCATVLGSLSGV
jgi:hypothetical protein